MKRKNPTKVWRALALALLSFLFFVCGCGCGRSGDEALVYCVDAGPTAYADALGQVLPSHVVVEDSPHVFARLERGAVAEAYDVQAASALKNGIATHWYPQYLATVVIAIDRDKTDAHIESWSDLPTAGEPVALANEGIGWLMQAVAYGLEGEGFSLGQAAGLLADLQAQGRLAKDGFDSPVVVGFDYQAAALIKAGRNIELVVPREGTLSFARGLLSNSEIQFAADPDPVLLAAGLRLPDGQCDGAIYPDAAAYQNAHLVKDQAHFAAISQEANRVLRRSVFHTRVYSSTDQREHQYFAMLYIILVIIWTASFIQRAMQRGVRRVAFLTGAVLLGWIVVRLIKYQLTDASTFNRMLWYAFYLFQLSLPLMLLWLAWAIDKQDEQLGVPRWLRALCVVNAALILLVFTNDWHNWVFRLDVANPNWSKEYEYGPGYYLALAGAILPLLAALGMMLAKSRRNPRKKGFVFPLAFCVLLFLYGYGYITRVPLAWDSDFTMTVGLFTLLFVEACFRTGLIPVNTKYAALFAHSPLGMQIFDRAGKPALASRAGVQVDETWLPRALAAQPLPAQKDENTLVYASEIAGGSALWQEDISALGRLHKEIEASVRKLAAANAVLAEEEKMRRTLDEETAKAQLMEQLEAEIAGHSARLAGMIGQLGDAKDERKEMLRIALLLCYIKRRCNLFFRQQEAGSFSGDELRMYIDELAELTGYGGSKLLVASELFQSMPVRMATLFYDFFYAGVEWAVVQACRHMLVRLGLEGDRITLRLLPAVDASGFVMDAELNQAIALAGGRWEKKDLGDAIGLGLSFPKGGEGGG